MKRAAVVVVLFASFIATSGSGGGQTPAGKKDAQATFEPRSGPGEGQKFLTKFVGDWTVAKAFYPRGGGEPTRAIGECKQIMIHDGRFLQSTFEFSTGSAKTTGLGLTGFDPASGHFTSVWTDSRRTGMSFRQSRDKFDGKQIVMFSAALGGDTESRRSRTVTRLEDSDNRIVHRQYNVGADGAERLIMELTMTRKPAR